MDYDSSSKFISSLAKFLQSLCNGYVEFDNGVEVIGHIYLSVDTGKKIDYILNEKVCKTDENSVTFISNSFHAQPAEKPKPSLKKSKDSDSKTQDNAIDLDADNNSEIEPRSTNYGTIPNNINRNHQSPSHRHGKRPSSPKSGRRSPKRNRIESQEPSHISDNLSQNPSIDLNQNPNTPGFAGPSFGADYTDSYQNFNDPDETSRIKKPDDRDIKPNIDTDVTFVKEEFASPSQVDEGSGEQNHGDDPAYSQMYHPSYSGGPGFSNQSSYGLPGSSRLSYGATDGSEIFDPGQGSSHMDGDGMEPPGMGIRDMSKKTVQGSFDRSPSSHSPHQLATPSSSASSLPLAHTGDRDRTSSKPWEGQNTFYLAAKSMSTNHLAMGMGGLSQGHSSIVQTHPIGSTFPPLAVMGSSVGVGGVKIGHSSSAISFSHHGAGTSSYLTVNKSGVAAMCSRCGGKYTNAATCAAHESKCTGTNRLMCHICKRVYSQMCALKEHLRGKHGVGDLLTCKFCGRSFKYKPQLYDHKDCVGMLNRNRTGRLGRSPPFGYDQDTSEAMPQRSLAISDSNSDDFTSIKHEQSLSAD